MQKQNLEIPFSPPTAKTWREMNRAQRPALMISMRDAIIRAIGEGPWPKAYLPQERSAVTRMRVVKELRRRWKPSQRVLVEMHTRAPYDFAASPVNPFESFQPLWGALQWAGWLVSDQEHWVIWKHCGHVIGDPKTVMHLAVLTELEAARIEAAIAAERKCKTA